MTIKSDKWIRRMAEQTGMIEPFEPGQIREQDGRKIISYGTSSYGYVCGLRLAAHPDPHPAPLRAQIVNTFLMTTREKRA